MIKLFAFIFACAPLAGCDRAPQGAPTVIGIPFAVPITAIKQHLPEGAKPTQYPLIPMYGYKLQFANPENWEVIVQDEAPDELHESRIYAIYLGRALGRACNRSDTEAVISDLLKKHESFFSATAVHRIKEEEAVALVAVDERRMFSATASCFIQNLGVRFTYLDLDRYQYRRPDDMKDILKKSTIETKEFKNRVLN